MEPREEAAEHVRVRKGVAGSAARGHPLEAAVAQERQRELGGGLAEDPEGAAKKDDNVIDVDFKK